MKILGVIPVRYASTRFPGKPLIDIKGKSMVQRVYEQSKKAEQLTDVIVATDDARIYDHVTNFGGRVMMTSSSHQSGTDRCAEVAEKVEQHYDVVINIQGDEPFIDPTQIDQLCTCFNDTTIGIATLIKKISSHEELFNKTKPKVVKSSANFALLFSRTAIPCFKGIKEAEWLKQHTYYKHIGIYGYTKSTLKEITKIAPSSLELVEGLEQLRWLENGFPIKVAETEMEAWSIDTPEDLEKVLLEMQ